MSYFPIIIGLLLWIVPVLHPVSASGADGNARKPAAVDYASEEWEGKESVVGEPLDPVVTDGGEWRRLWLKAFSKRDGLKPVLRMEFKEEDHMPQERQLSR